MTLNEDFLELGIGERSIRTALASQERLRAANNLSKHLHQINLTGTICYSEYTLYIVNITFQVI